MNRTWILIAVGIVVGLFAVQQLTAPSAPTVTKSAHVIDVTDATFEAEVLKHDGPVVIKAYADWCGPCHVYEPIFHDFAEKNPDKVKYASFDGDHNRGIMRQLGVGGYPTTVCIKDGKIQSTQGGVMRESRLAAFVEACQ